MNDVLAAILAIEAARLHGAADGGIEGASGFLSNGKCELHRVEEQSARGHFYADAPAELHQFALRNESRAAFFDAIEPRKRARYGFFGNRRIQIPARSRRFADHVHGY